MAETVDKLTVNYEEDGLLLCKELGRYELSKGAWGNSDVSLSGLQSEG